MVMFQGFWSTSRQLDVIVPEPGNDSSEEAFRPASIEVSAVRCDSERQCIHLQRVYVARVRIPVRGPLHVSARST